MNRCSTPNTDSKWVWFNSMSQSWFEDIYVYIYIMYLCAFLYHISHFLCMQFKSLSCGSLVPVSRKFRHRLDLSFCRKFHQNANIFVSMCVVIPTAWCQGTNSHGINFFTGLSRYQCHSGAAVGNSSRTKWNIHDANDCSVMPYVTEAN